MQVFLQLEDLIPSYYFCKNKLLASKYALKKKKISKESLPVLCFNWKSDTPVFQQFGTVNKILELCS